MNHQWSCTVVINLNDKIKSAIKEHDKLILHKNTADSIINTEDGTDMSKVCQTCLMYEYTKAVLQELLIGNKKIEDMIEDEEKNIHHPSDLNNIPDHFETKLPSDLESCQMCLMNNYTKNVLERLRID